MSDLKKLVEKQKNFYKGVVSVFCPILNNTVYFTSDGFNHLLYESNRMPRKIGEQFMKTGDAGAALAKLLAQSQQNA